MPIAAIIGFLAANPQLIMAVPGAVEGIVGVVESIINHPGTPEEVKAKLEALKSVLEADVADLPNVPKVN